MTAIHTKDYRPAVPRTSPRLLAGNFATEALAVKLDGGAIDPYKGPSLVYTSDADAIGSLFRYRSGATDYWLEWEGAGVDVARSPNAQDQFQRLYWTGDGEPRMGALSAITTLAPYPTSSGWFVLGVYAGTTAANVSPSGGVSATMETRVYAWSFVTQYGEEGPLCPVFNAVTGRVDDTWALTNLEAVPPNSGTISAATHSAGVVTVTLDTVRGLRAGEKVIFAGVVGMTDLNGTRTLLSVNTGTNQVTVALNTAQVYGAGADTWTRVAPHNTTGMKRRIYRSVGTNLDWKLVAEQSPVATTYNDTVASTALGGGPTVADDTAMPPTNGHSVVELANGALAMLAGNQVCISEREKPHSWPEGNRYTFAGTGVAMVAVGDSLIVGTDSNPVLVTAALPEAASPTKLEGVQAACLSKASMVDTGSGALMASHDGLWFLSAGGSRNITRELFTPEQWTDLAPSTFRAAFLNGEYLALRTPADGSPPRLFILDTAKTEGIVEVEDAFDAIYANPLDGRLYVGKANKVYLWDEDDANRYLGSWTGAVHQLGRPTNFAVAQVHAEFGDIQPLNESIEEANEALLASHLTMLGPLGMTPLLAVPIMGTEMLPQPEQTARKVVFTLLEGDAVKFSTEVASEEPFRLPSDFQQRTATIRLTTSCRVYSATVAQGMRELAQVAT